MAIDYLKRSQIGRATFLPLNRLDPGELPQAPKRPGIVDYALNLVDFDSKFFSAFWYVFRDALVVENLDAARQLMGRYRMVTLVMQAMPPTRPSASQSRGFSVRMRRMSRYRNATNANVMARRLSVEVGGLLQTGHAAKGSFFLW